ncbi:hypothetical protein HHI36_002562 [Cryptolaemus montrouzieri]|uniref:Uncharacterized protein n=1 Tax=Cryptolaemus montrouzieri TaxID=559131 RepID=A0ABD2PAR2_9CUCU
MSVILLGGAKSFAKETMEVTRNIMKRRRSTSSIGNCLLAGEELYLGKICNCKKCEETEQVDPVDSIEKASGSGTSIANRHMVPPKENLQEKKKSPDKSNNLALQLLSEPETDDQFSDWEKKQEFFCNLQKKLQSHPEIDISHKKVNSNSKKGSIYLNGPKVVLFELKSELSEGMISQNLKQEGSRKDHDLAECNKDPEDGENVERDYTSTVFTKKLRDRKLNKKCIKGCSENAKGPGTQEKILAQEGNQSDKNINLGQKLLVEPIFQEYSEKDFKYSKGQKHLLHEAKSVLNQEISSQNLKKQKRKGAEKNSDLAKYSKETKNVENGERRLRNLPKQNYKSLDSRQKLRNPINSCKKNVQEKSSNQMVDIEKNKDLSKKRVSKKQPHQRGNDDNVFLTPERIRKPKKQKNTNIDGSTTRINSQDFTPALTIELDTSKRRRTLYSPGEFEFTDEAKTLFGIQD